MGDKYYIIDNSCNTCSSSESCKSHTRTYVQICMVCGTNTITKYSILYHIEYGGIVVSVCRSCTLHKRVQTM